MRNIQTQARMSDGPTPRCTRAITVMDKLLYKGHPKYTSFHNVKFLQFHKQINLPK